MTVCTPFLSPPFPLQPPDFFAPVFPFFTVPNRVLLFSTGTGMEGFPVEPIDAPEVAPVSESFSVSAHLSGTVEMTLDSAAASVAAVTTVENPEPCCVSILFSSSQCAEAHRHRLCLPR